VGAGLLPWGILVWANLSFAPVLPWAAIIMAAYLLVYWKYLQGRGWPESTARARLECLRAPHLPAAIWCWSLLAGGLSLTASISLFIVVRRMVNWPHPGSVNLDRFPAVTILATLFMSAVVSGVAEEAGFRGYMQSMMERRYGPAVAIAATSLVFGFAHLSHGFFLPALLFDMVWGALYGLLAYSSGSILPGLLYHSSLDFLEFILAWKLGAKGNPHLVWVSGPDLWFWGNCLTVLVLGPASVWAFLRLSRMKQQSRVESSDGKK
jgi:membrane protease YdiL (CAAX protease family)